MQVKALQLDLASFSSVRLAVRELHEWIAAAEVPPLDALLCNAGAQFRGPISYSKDGYEETFATNHLGHFLLVDLLIDNLSKTGRVVFTASGTHDPDTMDGKMVGRAVEPNAHELAIDGKDGKKPISGGQRYATSKLCTILFAYELNRRLKKNHSAISSIAFDPGLIPETGLMRTAPALVGRLMRTSSAKWLMRKLGVTMGSLSFSGDSLARIAIDPEFAHSAGQYLQSTNGSLIEARSSKASYDEDPARRLWSDSEELVQLQPSELAEVLK